MLFKKKIGVEGKKRKGNPFFCCWSQSWMCDGGINPFGDGRAILPARWNVVEEKSFLLPPLFCVGFIFPWTDNRMVLLRRQSDPLIRVDVFPVFKLNLILFPPPQQQKSRISFCVTALCSFLHISSIDSREAPHLSLVSSSLRFTLPVSQREERESWANLPSPPKRPR